ncbi:MAG TPA: DUF3486 family protein [Rubrivivax sp.]|nr:DUF3486 family protein [Rubrivivax sp.]HRY86999.1 DUF3486 family protein [Rubrivivax sp.]HRZ59572.1 DUF3486 family protein [Rubrivivax sp.]
MPPRGKIAQLPEALRAWLHKALVERGFGDIVALTEELNALCKEGGVAISIGKSAVGRESQRVQRAQEAIRATTEAARLIAQSAPDEGDHRSAAAMALVQSEVFELLLKIRESDEIDDPVERLGVMNDAALGLSRMSRSRVNQARWADELDKRAQDAAARVAQLAKKGGMDARTVSEIRASILGIVKRAPDAAGVA